MTPARRSPALMQAGDAELLQSLAAGDLGALGEVYDRYARDVWRAARRALGEGADVEDVVQGPRRTERSRAGCDHDSSHVFASSRDCG